MQVIKVAAKGFAAGTALCAALGTAQAATVSECRALIGFNSGTGAWGTVTASAGSFLANNTVPKCDIKVVSASTKGKPSTTTLTIDATMTQDQCSMYNHLSSADSKLDMAKVGDAYVTIGAMLAKLNVMFGSGKLQQPGYDDMTKAATAVQSCIAELMSQ